MATTRNCTSELRIARKYPGIAWQRVWTNVHNTGLSDTIKSTLYAAIHEIIPKKERLGSNSSHHNNVLREMRGNRYTTASANCLRGRTSDVDLDKNQDSGSTTHTPQTHTRGMDATPDLPSLAPQKQAAIIRIVACLVAYRP